MVPLLSQHEVFLIDNIERGRTDKMPHLKAVYFLRPTPQNIALLQAEFGEPKYGEYHIFFSNLTKDGQIQALAEVSTPGLEADQMHCVAQGV